MSAVQNAAVIGGGIAGPAAAIALQRAGIATTIYEAYSGPSDGIGSTLAIAANGMAALDVIGAGDSVRAAAIPISTTSMSVTGKPIELPYLTDLEPQQMIERGDLYRLMRERAVAEGVDFVFGKRLVGTIEQPSSISAQFADDTSVSADILIGADGVHSTVRGLIDPNAPAAGYTGLLGFGGLVDVDLGLDPGTMHFAFGKRAYYLYWSVPGGQTAWGVNLPSKQSLSLTEARAIPAHTWLATLRETYAGDQPGESLARGTTPESLVVIGALHIMQPVPRWHRGRMVLVGDAVHAPSNSTGQGASLAIESAIELARCLRDLPDVPSAFASYEHLRRARVERIAKRGARLSHAKAPGPVARRMMQLVMPTMFRHMNLEKQLGAELRYRIDWNADVSTTKLPVSRR